MRFSAASATLVALLALAGCSRDPVGDRPDYVATASGRLDARVEARFLAAERDGRLGRTQVKDLTLWFEGDSLTRWEGEYFPEQDLALAQNANRRFGGNLAKDKDKKKRGQ